MAHQSDVVFTMTIMFSITYKWAKYLFFLFFVVFSLPNVTYSQLLIGPSVGGQLSWASLGDDYTFADSEPVWGYNGGLMIAFKVGERYYLQTEYVYSRKGRRITGAEGFSFEFEQTQHHFDLPIIYRIDFKASLFNLPSFKYYFGIGPNISYWWKANGTVQTNDLLEDGIPELKYDVVFDKENVAEDELNVPDPNRIQLGVNIAVGLLLEPASGGHYLLQLRYEHGHSFLAQEDVARFDPQIEYADPLRVRNSGLRLSFAYLIDTKIAESKKGKSTIKRRNQ